MEALKNIIPQVGFNVPIYIDTDGVIIKGHARYRAACQLGMQSVPCIVSENTDEQNRLDRVADNKISELAEWDVPNLQNEIDTINFDFSKIGMEVDTTVVEESFDENAFSGFGHNSQPEKMTVPVSEKQESIRRIDFVNARCPRCGNKMIINLK